MSYNNQVSLTYQVTSAEKNEHKCVFKFLIQIIIYEHMKVVDQDVKIHCQSTWTIVDFLCLWFAARAYPS